MPFLRKCVSILLIALLFLNLFGYRMVFQYAKKLSDTKLETSLDKFQYNENDLITVSVPLSNPYHISQSAFERIDGEMTIDGKLYKYVKRRVFNGELILLCIPNHGKMRIEDEKKNYFANANGISDDAASKKQDNSTSRIIKNPLVEYDQLNIIHSQPGWWNIKGAANSISTEALPSIYLAVQDQPPRMAA